MKTRMSAIGRTTVTSFVRRTRKMVMINDIVGTNTNAVVLFLHLGHSVSVPTLTNSLLHLKFKQ